MSPSRRALVYALLGAIAAGHLFCALTFRNDLWPFSRYAMFSTPRSGAHVAFFVVGDDGEREIELWREYRYLRPLYNGSVQRTFKHMAREPGGQDRMAEAARELLRRYVQGGRSGLHDGPHLAALRVYERGWLVDPEDRAPRPPAFEKLWVDVSPGHP